MRPWLREIERLEGGGAAPVGLGLLVLGAVASWPIGYRGVGRLSRLIGRTPGLRAGAAVVRLGPGQRLRIPLADYYWSRLLFRDFAMEPELGRILDRVLEPSSVFLDCGANIGFWSLVASAWIDDPDRILAMEPAPSTFARLEQTADLNGHPFVPIRAAVCEEDGAALRFRVDARHARSRVVATSDEGPGVIEVTGRSLDALMAERATPLPDAAAIVVKVDVEGHEAEVLRGARGLLRRDNALLLYEDHADDIGCEASRYVLDELAYWVAPAEAPSTRLVDLEAVRLWKRGRRGGLNFVAGHPGGEVLARASSPEGSLRGP